MSESCEHDFEEDYYGFFHCKKCEVIWPPWAFDQDEYDDYWNGEPDLYDAEV